MGQFILVQPRNAVNRNKKSRLPTVAKPIKKVSAQMKKISGSPPAAAASDRRHPAIRVACMMVFAILTILMMVLTWAFR
jgi:hypothetical protein